VLPVSHAWPECCEQLTRYLTLDAENEHYPEAESMIKRVLSIQKRERGMLIMNACACLRFRPYLSELRRAPCAPRTGPFSVPTATAWSVLAGLCLRQRYVTPSL
jgi:hypothetical protein